ncbi:C6 zinc finger domain protein [Xylariaceae sp. FL0255]|nr:C6 zinc finger domain protein [Xylariaceae sp. FL0255]
MDTEVQTGRAGRKRRGGPRKKTGCATCKARHTRCDERMPTCLNCERLSLECRPSEFISHSSWNNAGSATRTVDELVSESLQIQPWPSRPPNTLQDPGKKLDLHPDNGNSGASELSPPRMQPPLPTVVLRDEAVRLLTIFRRGLATWMDIFDFNETYQRKVCQRAIHSYLILYSICAFTAKHISLLPSGGKWQQTASYYYGEALQCLIVALNDVQSDHDGDELTASMLLGSYEVISASKGPHYSFYKGSMNLIQSRSISATSSGVNRANFFIYVRHGITIALAREKSLQFDPKDWNMPPLEQIGSGEDELGNYLLWISAKVVDLIYSQDAVSADRKSLMGMTDCWYRRTESMRGVSYGDVDDEGLQKMFFAVPAAAAAMLWYNLTRLLLLAEPTLLDSASKELVEKHVKSILEIAISRITPNVYCFAIMPVYFAGKHTTDVSRKLRAYSILDEIQREVGYSTRDQMQALSVAI